MSWSIPILFEDNHVLVVVKPPNLLSQSDQSGDADLLSELKAMIKVRDQKPGNVYLGLVHRLDRMVGGVMVFAKTSKAASRLSDAVRRRQFEKTYWAIVQGKPERAEQRLVHWLKKDSATNTVKIVKPQSTDSKEAMLDYHCLETIQHVRDHQPFSLLEIQLLTGRPHQIRVQCAAIGCPLYGDTKYGATQTNVPIGLWAVRLQFEHPVSKEWLQFESLPSASNIWPLFANFQSKTQ